MGAIARPAKPAVDWRRVVRRASQGVLAVIAVWALVYLATGFDHRWGGPGSDWTPYMDATRSWLAGRGFYHPYQLLGPYPQAMQPVGLVYPPLVLWLLVPFTVLPSWLWWAIPLWAVGWALWRLRPAWWVWPALLAIAVLPGALDDVLFGSIAMWAWAAVFVGAATDGPAALALMKPTFLPFALLGVRTRRWWAVFGLGLLAAAPFGVTMWTDWFTAVRNVQAPPIWYVRDWAMMAMPLVVWLGRTPRTVATAADTSRFGTLGRRGSLLPRQ